LLASFRRQGRFLIGFTFAATPARYFVAGILHQVSRQCVVERLLTCHFSDAFADVTSCIVSQTFGGMVFALISGQPMLIVVTTAPLALYVKGKWTSAS